MRSSPSCWRQKLYKEKQKMKKDDVPHVPQHKKHHDKDKLAEIVNARLSSTSRNKHLMDHLPLIQLEKKPFMSKHEKKIAALKAKPKKKKLVTHLVDAESKHETLFQNREVPEEDNKLWNYINEQADDNLWDRIRKYRHEMRQRHLPDNYRIISTDSDPTLRSTFYGHQGEITSLDFSPDTSRLASVSMDSSLYLWKLKGQYFPMKYVHHELGGVKCVKFSPQIQTGDYSHLIATGGKDQYVRLLMLGLGDDTPEEAIQRPHHSMVIKAHDGTVNDIAFDRSGNYVLSCSDDNTSKVSNHTSTVSLIDFLVVVPAAPTAVKYIHWAQIGSTFL